jgi:hypothetical protein
MMHITLRSMGIMAEYLSQKVEKFHVHHYSVVVV